MAEVEKRPRVGSEERSQTAAVVLAGRAVQVRCHALAGKTHGARVFRLGDTQGVVAPRNPTRAARIAARTESRVQDVVLPGK